MTTKKDIPCLILGIGNILWADEGFGIRAVERFNEKYALTDPANKIVDGGTLGMYLYDMICRCENLLIFDCCDFHGRPGELHVLRDKEISQWASCKLSPHQSGMNDLLQAAALQLASPLKLTVVGFQPVLLDDYGGSLSGDAKATLDQACDYAFDELKSWGVGLRKRTPDVTAEPLTGSSALNMKSYEEGRPSQEEADRTGDRRFAYICAREE